MAIDIVKFHLSLTSAIASMASLELGRDIFLYDANERITAEVYAVLRPYGGPVPGRMLVVPHISIQVMTYASDAEDGFALSQTIYEALHVGAGSQRRPRCHWTISGKKRDGKVVVDDTGVSYFIRSVLPIQPPGLIGRDSGGQNQVSFNFDVRFNEA